MIYYIYLINVKMFIETHENITEKVGHFDRFSAVVFVS